MNIGLAFSQDSQHRTTVTKVHNIHHRTWPTYKQGKEPNRTSLRRTARLVHFGSRCDNEQSNIFLNPTAACILLPRQWHLCFLLAPVRLVLPTLTRFLAHRMPVFWLFKAQLAHFIITSHQCTLFKMLPDLSQIFLTRSALLA